MLPLFSRTVATSIEKTRKKLKIKQKEKKLYSVGL